MLLQVGVEEGDVVVIKIDGEIIGAYGIDTGANLVNNEGTVTIRQTGTVDVYFKVWADGGYSIYVTGYEAPVEGSDYYLVGSMSDWGEGETYQFVTHNENEVKLLGVALEANTEIKVKVAGTWDNAGGYYQVKEGCRNLVSEGDGGNIIINSSGVYDFYWDFSSNQLWIERTGDLDPVVPPSSEDPVTSEDPSSEPEEVVYETYDIYYYNYNEWDNVYIYAWTATASYYPVNAWPGTAMTAEGDGWYKFTLNVDETKVAGLSLIFNNDDGAQTPNITANNNEEQFYLGSIADQEFASKAEVEAYVEELNKVVAQEGYVYLKPNSNWTQANARFAAYFFNNSTSQNIWVDMTYNSGLGYYECQIPEGTWPNVIFCRMNPATTANNWDNGVKWNQTADLTLSNSNNAFTVKSGTWDNGGGDWSLLPTE